MARILIVDDEPANRLLFLTLLQYAGHDVFEAGDGSAALEQARRIHPDLIVADLYLPGMHGTQLVKALRADPETARTRIALYTGTKLDGMLADFMRLYGISHVIPKPSEPEDLIRAVDEALQA